MRKNGSCLERLTKHLVFEKNKTSSVLIQVDVYIGLTWKSHLLVAFFRYSSHGIGKSVFTLELTSFKISAAL